MRFLFVAAVAAAMIGGTAGVAGASNGTYLIASWNMNEGGGTRTMFDSSGNGFNGNVGGEVLTGVGVGGATGYRFTALRPDTPPPHPRHIVTVPDSAALDPGNRDYIVTMRLRTTYQFGNIVQKGQATVAGGNWKLQIPAGIVQCLFRGSRGTVIVSSAHRFNDGNWHVVRCERDGGGVTLNVDGRTEAHRDGWTGTIANSWPVSIGGKVSCDQQDVGCDYFAGDLDWVTVEAR